MSDGAAWQAPAEWPRPAGAVRVRTGAERLLGPAIFFALVAVTVLDRFGLRVTQDWSVPPGMLAMYGLAAAMLLTGAAEVNARAAAAYVGVVAVAGASFLVNSFFEPRSYRSFTAFVLVLVLYAPFTLSLARGAVDARLWKRTVRLFVGFAVFVALAGIAQYAAQFVLDADWLFDYTPLIPERLRASGGWNTVYGTGDWIKSNGFFLREPSIFSTLLALALLCELVYWRRKGPMALLSMGIVFSYSGSGILCLASGLVFLPWGRHSTLRIAAWLLAGAGLLYVMADALNLSYTADRLGEFGSERSSAYCRFIYPGTVALGQLDATPWTALLGNGPGTMVRMGATCADGHQTTYAKALFEYGFAGVLAFGVLLLGALNRSGAPLGLRVALGVTWVLLGGNLASSEVLLLIYVLSAMWPRDIARERRG